jgi:hypothetical protein
MDATYMSPVLGDTQLPTDGVPIQQPKEQNPKDTISSPIIADKDLSFIESKSKSTMSGGSGDQVINGVVKIGLYITLDGPNGRIIINDGEHDRIIIGFYPL